MSKIDSVIRHLRGQGFVLVRNARHVILRSPSGRTIVVSKTIKSSRAWNNLRSQVLAAGGTLTPTRVGGRPGLA